MRLFFGDGTSARVYRETVVDVESVGDPCVLTVTFRLRLIGGNAGAHGLFRGESILNTPLFVGFPGFVSKLWFAHDEQGKYRGIYQWDGVERAEHYARSLWRVLAIGSVPGSIHYIVLPAMQRSDFVEGHYAAEATASGDETWWRVRSSWRVGPQLPLSDQYLQ
jgi:hypothetical protein